MPRRPKADRLPQQGPGDPPALAALFRLHPGAALPFIAAGMLCPACPVAAWHGLGDACAAYGLDEAGFGAAVQAAIAAGATRAGRRGARLRPAGGWPPASGGGDR